MRAIEAGCRAVVVNSRAGNNGVVVRVLGIAGQPGMDGFDPKDGVRWRTDKKLKTSRRRWVGHVGEKQLRRIDEDWGKTTDFDESIWTPHKQGVEV